MKATTDYEAMAREIEARIARRNEDAKTAPVDAARRRYINWGGVNRVVSTGQRFRGTCGR